MINNNFTYLLNVLSSSRIIKIRLSEGTSIYCGVIKLINRGRAKLRHEWVDSTWVISRPHRKSVRNSTCTVFQLVSDDTEGRTTAPISQRIAKYLWRLWCTWATRILYHHHYSIKNYNNTLLSDIKDNGCIRKQLWEIN